MQNTKIQSSSQLSAIMNASQDAIISTTLECEIVSWSRSAERIYGYSATEMLGQSLDLLVPVERRAEIARAVDKIKSGQAVEAFETNRLAKDGQSLWVEISLTPVTDAAQNVCGLLAIARDNTVRREAEVRMREIEAAEYQRAVIMDTANRVALDILSSRTGIEALRHIADAARVLVGARYAALGVARRIGNLPQGAQELQDFITVGITPEEQEQIGPLPRGRGILGLLLERTNPLRIDVLAEHSDSVGFPPNHPPMTSFLGVPIRRGDTTIGSLYLTNKQDGAFTEADEAAVEALGAHAAVAIHNLQLLSSQRALVAGLMSAQEEERRAIAYDLHDGLTQYVMASHAHLEAFKHAHENDKADKARRELAQGLKYLKESVLESRRLVNGLRSLALDDLGLSGALEQLVNEEKAHCGWETAELIQNIAERRFGKMLETTAYRVAQEALTNARKHAQTSRVQVLASYEVGGNRHARGTELLRLQVRDWGQGFEPNQQEVESGHIGLQGMAERVHLLGGNFELNSAPGKGTTVTASFPILPVRSRDGEESA